MRTSLPFEEEPNIDYPLRAQGRTPLRSAAIENHPTVVERLIEKGADVKAKDKVKCTPVRPAPLPQLLLHPHSLPR
jgi:ankyrin repeat protein